MTIPGFVEYTFRNCEPGTSRLIGSFWYIESCSKTRVLRRSRNRGARIDRLRAWRSISRWPSSHSYGFCRPRRLTPAVHAWRPIVSLRVPELDGAQSVSYLAIQVCACRNRTRVTQAIHRRTAPCVRPSLSAGCLMCARIMHVSAGSYGARRITRRVFTST